MSASLSQPTPHATCPPLGNLQPEEVLVSVPRATAITLAPKQRAPAFVKPEFWANTKACPWFVKMGLLVLQEKRAGSASRLAPYIDQLPEKFDLPVLWDDAKLQQLQYPHLIHQVQGWHGVQWFTM